MGTSDTLPLGAICSTATARGPASFLRGTLRSPGVICGRSSCAAALNENAAIVASKASESAPQHKIRRCKILKNVEQPEVPAGTRPALNVHNSGDIPMKVNDKAPDFTLQNENGEEIALKDLRGKTVVLYFFPRADTPG